MNSVLTDDPAHRAVTADDRGVTAADPVRPLDWRRLKGTAGTVAMAASLIAALAQTFGTVVAGWLADHATTALVGVLAACLLGSGVLDAVGRLIWAGVVDRAEGGLRTDLLTATMRQPVEALTEQAVGEILDRVDDDTHELGNLSREIFWRLAQTVFAVPALYVVAGVSWWPAWVLFPIAAVLTFVLIRGPLREIGVRKVLEEAAWTDHAAALEEAVAGRDDLRTSLGQAHAIRRLATLSARIHRRFADVVILEGRTVRRSGLMLHCLLVATVIIGVGMVSSGGMSVSELVTVFLAATLFVGQVDQASRQLPDLQAGVGAIIRLRQLLGVPAEPVGGRPVAAGQVGLRFDHLEFAYAEGTFGLRDIDIDIPAGSTCALVGRSGSGKSTLASLVTRTMEPRRGTVYLGGSDVLDLDLQQLRAAVGVVTQRTEILAGTLAENITLFEPFPRQQIEAAIDQLALGDWVGGLPDGLDTPLGPGGLSISAGEEQLVAFARLLVRDVKVVILDEATARMDPLTERRVVAAADRLLTGRTGIVVAHRLSTTERAQSVAVLEHGRVIQHGPREALASRFHRVVAWQVVL